jgi:hypothetical protein
VLFVLLSDSPGSASLVNIAAATTTTIIAATNTTTTTTTTPVAVLNRDTYFSTPHLNHSVSQPELPRLVIAVWPHDVQRGWITVTLGSAGGSTRPASNLVQNAKNFRTSLMAARCRQVYGHLPLPNVVVTRAVTRLRFGIFWLRLSAALARTN